MIMWKYNLFNYVPSIDSRQIYKNQFDKKEKDAKKSTLFL